LTARTPIDRVAEFLTSAGYRRVAAPLEIASLKFEFAAIFVGSPDLVVVADTAFDDERRILTKVQGVARALDAVRSKRPLTAVLAGPRPSSATLESMSRVCRVLPIGTLSDEQPDVALHNWLAVLTPLKLPEPTAGIAEPLVEIASHLEGLSENVAGLVDLAQQGGEAVRLRLYELISEPLEGESQSDQT